MFVEVTRGVYDLSNLVQAIADTEFGAGDSA